MSKIMLYGNYGDFYERKYGTRVMNEAYRRNAVFLEWKVDKKYKEIVDKESK